MSQCALIHFFNIFSNSSWVQSPSKKGDDGSTIGALRIATAIVAKLTRLNAAYDNSNASNIFDIILFRSLDANISKKIYISKGNCAFFYYRWQKKEGAFAYAAAPSLG